MFANIKLPLNMQIVFYNFYYEKIIILYTLINMWLMYIVLLFLWRCGAKDDTQITERDCTVSCVDGHFQYWNVCIYLMTSGKYYVESTLSRFWYKVDLLAAVALHCTAVAMVI